MVGRSLLSLPGDVGANDAVFASRKGGGRLTERAVNGMLKRAAKAAGINEAVSPALGLRCRPCGVECLTCLSER